jgi:C4-dicarboxylate transporter
MIELSVALVIVAAMAFYLVNKYLDMQKPINSIEQPVENIDVSHFQSQLDVLRKELNEFKLSAMMHKR